MSKIEINFETNDTLTDIELDLLQQQIQFILTAQAVKMLDMEITQIETK